MEIEETNIDVPSEFTIQASCLRTHSMHRPSTAEEEILKQLEDYKDSTVLSANVLTNLVESLLNYTEYWTQKQIWDQWYNRYKRA